MKLSKIVSLIVVLIGIVSFGAYYMMIRNLDADTADQYIDALINLAKILLYVAAIAAAIGFIMDIFSSKRSLKYTLISFVIFGAIVFMAYLKASHEPYKLGDTVYSASVSTWVDTGLWTFYYLTIIALVSMIFTWIADYFRS